MANLNDLNVAIAHYWCIKERGGEKVLKHLLSLFPQADVYTLFYEPSTMGHLLKGHQVFTSCLDHALLRKHYTKLFPLYPTAVRSLKLQKKYDLLISSESGPIKGIQKPNDTPHLCYTHTPMRYCWEHMEDYLHSLPALFRPLAKRAFYRLRAYDLNTIDNVDVYLANSAHVKDRIFRYYGKLSTVVHPPLEDDFFKAGLTPLPNERAPYLSFGALVPYKRIDLLIETFNQNGKPLIIAGDGPERTRLQAIAKNNITFKGPISNKDLVSTIQNCKALLFPGEEDFGIIPLEVMALGRPVIAYKKGGALETVVEDANLSHATGMFFTEQTHTCLQACLQRFEDDYLKLSPDYMRNHAMKFNTATFCESIKKNVQQLLSNTSKKFT